MAARDRLLIHAQNVLKSQYVLTLSCRDVPGIVADVSRCLFENGGNIVEGNQTPLEPGMVFSIEPGVYLKDFGIRSEINVVITPGSQVKVTTPPQQELVRLV